MHYGLQEAEENLDYFGNMSTLGLSHPLMATVILYLSNVARGGELLFTDSEVKDFLMFFHYHKEVGVLRISFLNKFSSNCLR